MKLQDLRKEHLGKLYDDLERAGGRNGKPLAPKTVGGVHGVLHKALRDAVRNGLVVRNVANLVQPPKSQRPTPTWWSPEELRGFLRHVADDRLYAMWLLFATTGMRRGEVLGLAWEDVDLDKARVRVSWTLGTGDSIPTWKRRAKTASGNRLMALDPATVEALRKYKARQAEERMFAGPAWQTIAADGRGEQRSNLVFTWPDGSLISPDRVTVWFSEHVKAAGLTRVRLHDIRHTYASAALSRATGWHEVKVISQRMGHASIGITLDTYSHALPSADEEAATSLARVILGTP